MLWTLWMIPRDQPDLRENGTFLSLVIIYLANLLLLVLLLCAAHDAPLSSAREFGMDWMRNAVMGGLAVVAVAGCGVPQAEHDKIVVQGPVKTLPGHLNHFSNPDIRTQIEKINVFADAFLDRQLADGKRWSVLHTVFRPLWRFFRAYVLRRGFLDGYAGLYIASVTSFATLVRYTRLYEHERTAATVHPGEQHDDACDRGLDVQSPGRAGRRPERVSDAA